MTLIERVCNSAGILFFIVYRYAKIYALYRGKKMIKKGNAEIKIYIIIFIMIALTGVIIFHNTAMFSLKKTTHKPIYFGASFMTMNNTYFTVIDEQLRSNIEAHGDYLLTMDPVLDADKQIEQVNYMLDQDIKVLFINPVDKYVMHEVLERCRQSNVKVIAIDSSLNQGDYVNYTVLSDNYEAGVMIAKEVMRQYDEADIVLLQHSEMDSAKNRIQGFLDEISKNEKFRIVERKECHGQLEQAVPVMEEVILSGKQFDIVMALNDPSALGAMAALERYHISDVEVYGIDGSPEMKDLVSKHKVAGTVLQYPKVMAKQALKAAYEMLDGKVYENELEVTNVTLLTWENIDEYSLKGWQ